MQIFTFHSGTTSLFYYLKENQKEILMPTHKELRFFSISPINNITEATERYSKLFPSINSSTVITGEATPGYLFYPQIPEQLFNIIPNVKLISLFRSPINRSLSAYFHLKRTRMRPPPHTFYELISYEIEFFTTCIKQSGEGICKFLITDVYQDISRNINEKISLTEQQIQISSKCYQQIVGDIKETRGDLDKFWIVMPSLYYFGLSNWLKYFPRNQLLLLQSEKFFANTSIYINSVESFLELHGSGSKSYTKVYSYAGSRKGASIYSTYKTEDKFFEGVNLLSNFLRPYTEIFERLVNNAISW